MNSTPQLKRTPLYDFHKKLGAKMAEFGGWEMPIEYSGIIHEHMAVRTAAGVFDISHMGELFIEGPEGLELIQEMTCNDASRLKNGQAQYSALLYPEGTFVDDILVYRFDQNRYFLCVNASNTNKDFDWICGENRFNTTATNLSDRYTQLAVQGPRAIRIMQRLSDIDLESIRYYWFRQGKMDGIECIVSRTGYTGEDGFEIFFAPKFSEQVWARLLGEGKDEGLIPVGLGARNTLRLEAKMALYGHEISDKITPWEADLGWIVKMGKSNFIGRAALEEEQTRGITKKLVGFEMVGKGIARDGYPVFIEREAVGTVTSGGPAPYLGKNIGLAYVPVKHCQTGTRLEIQIRTSLVPARIVETPFYKREKSRH